MISKFIEKKNAKHVRRVVFRNEQTQNESRLHTEREN